MLILVDLAPLILSIVESHAAHCHTLAGLQSPLLIFIKYEGLWLAACVILSLSLYIAHNLGAHLSSWYIGNYHIEAVEIIVIVLIFDVFLAFLKHFLVSVWKKYQVMPRAIFTWGRQWMSTLIKYGPTNDNDNASLAMCKGVFENWEVYLMIPHGIK